MASGGQACEKMIHKDENVRINRKAGLQTMEGRVKELGILYTDIDGIIQKMLELLDWIEDANPEIVSHGNQVTSRR